MKRLSLPVLVCCGCFGSCLSALQAADPEPTFEELGASSYRFDWTGEAGLTYFVQYSQDLQNWQYFPLIDHGVVHDPVDVTPLDASNNPLAKYFMRLVYTDVPTTDAEGDDFDGDGMSNIAELSLMQSDPLSDDGFADTDADGLPDVLELFWFGDLTQSAATDSDGDGLLNGDEFGAGTSPVADQTGMVAQDEYLYDENGRLKKGDSVEFGYDAEGNLESAE